MNVGRYVRFDVSVRYGTTGGGPGECFRRAIEATFLAHNVTWLRRACLESMTNEAVRG